MRRSSCVQRNLLDLLLKELVGYEALQTFSMDIMINPAEKGEPDHDKDARIIKRVMQFVIQNRVYLSVVASVFFRQLDE